VKRYLRFLAVGTIFSTIEEFLTIVVLKQDVGAYVFTVLILFPVFLTLVWVCWLAIDWLMTTPVCRELFHFFAFGTIGLMFEWFVIGLSPWSNVNAHPLVMLGFQLGMFSFWATVSFAPRLFIESTELAQRTRRSILRFYVPYFAVAYVICLSAPRELKFVTIIPLVLLGYLSLNLFYVRYFRALATTDRLFSSDATPSESAQLKEAP
jgi:hypothetical protein